MAEKTHSSTHPPLPPTTEDDRLDWLRLLRSRRVGIATFWRLLAEYGTARAALLALPGIAQAAGVGDYAVCPEGVVLAEVKAAKLAGARSLCAGDRAYPSGLREMADAPPFLWTKGDISLLSRPIVALVGARNASSLGERMARALATDLTKAGYVVASGLARGIDAAAHKAALAGGTVAVVAGGVDVIYPTENAALSAQIAASGLILSEQPMGLVPQARHFPARNRIISGMARAVVVVEAAAKSGSLITARTALDQGREVMAVPGHPMDARASGCNMLIRDGATLVRDAADVIEAVGPAQGLGDGFLTRANGMRTDPAPQNAANTIGGSLRHIAGDPGPVTAKTDGVMTLFDRSATLVSQETGTSSQAKSQPEQSSDVALPRQAAMISGALTTLTAPSAAQTPAPATQRSTGTAIRSLRETATLHRAILDRLGPSPLAEDQLIRDLDEPAQIVAPALLDLEMDGHVLRQPGGLLSRVH